MNKNSENAQKLISSDVGSIPEPPDKEECNNLSYLNNFNNSPKIYFEDSYVIKNIKISVPANESLGLRVRAGAKETDPVFIKSVSKSSPWRNLFRSNDIPITVNDIPLYGLGYENTIRTINDAKPDLNMTIRRSINFTDYLRIQFTIQQTSNQNQKAGFEYGRMSKWMNLNDDDSICGIYITNIFPTSFANNLLNVGDIITAVNNVVVSSNTYQYIEKLLNSINSPYITFMIFRHKKSIQPHELLHFQNPIFNNSHEEFDSSQSLIKVYKFIKLSDKFGMSIVGGYKGHPIFVGGVEPNTTAAEARVHIGDQIIKVNYLETSLMEQSNFVRIVREVEELLLVSISNPHGLQKFYTYVEFIDENKNFSSPINSKLLDSQPSEEIVSVENEQRTSFIVRALYNFDSSLDRKLPAMGLSFKFGDLLLIKNANDMQWWRAELLDYEGDSISPSMIGIIPSDQLYNERNNEKIKTVSFDPKVIHSKFKKSTIGFTSSSISLSGPSIKSSCRNFLSKDLPFEYLPYQIVSKVPRKMSRPLIIFGMYREKLMNELIEYYPRDFEVCALHTSRPRRDKELPTLSHKTFLSSEQMIKHFNQRKYIEFSCLKGNYYGTHIDDIIKIMSQNKYCIANVTYNAIPHLMKKEIYPMAFMIKPKNYQWLVASQRNLTAEEAITQVTTYDSIEKYYGKYFSSIITVSSFDEAYNHILKSIIEYHTDHIWVPEEFSSD